MIELFQFESCPYCRKVREKLESLEVDYICRPLGRKGRNREELLKIGGKVQVPFLVDNERSLRLYESEDIIEHLELNFGSEISKS
ncbi:MAG: glutathione S-transferase N-terminal domain-containing protein [Bdellovibrionales bacterium]|nr:glutathione S-transferase N-terminal domain-containing protein [Bdellovibrionales bacterium]